MRRHLKEHSGVSSRRRRSRVSSGTVEIIAAAVVTLRQIRQLATDARGTRFARQFAQSPSHYPIVVAIDQRNQCFAQ
jgi:hypothetical protein